MFSNYTKIRKFEEEIKRLKSVISELNVENRKLLEYFYIEKRDNKKLSDEIAELYSKPIEINITVNKRE